MRQIMVSMLRSMGINSVIVANTDTQCFELIASEKINLIICGWAMPKLNALAILKKLRSSEKTIEMPFIIVSTIIEQEQIKQAVINGVSEYLVPPFNKQIFESRIHKALKIPIRLTATKLVDKINTQRIKNKHKKADIDILIVDDIADNIEIIRGIIKEKYNVKAAINAKTALKICFSASPPDLILLDIMMPDVDGLALCKELKQNPVTQNIVIIFITALSENKDVVKGLSLGAVDYITKPVVPSILLARLNVHTKLIINQRVIQQQIDHLVEQSTTFNTYNSFIQSDLQHFVLSSTSAVTEIERQTSTNKHLKQTTAQLKYSISISELLIEKALVLKNLQNHSYKGKQDLIDIGNILLPIIDLFDCAIKNKNLERFEKLTFNNEITCDILLVKILFISLYRNLLETAPRGSQISVCTTRYYNFSLIEIHNVRRIDTEIIDSLERTTIDRDESHSLVLDVHIAFVIIKQLGGDLYFHSSEEFGTTFYIKLPFSPSKKQ